MTWYLTLLLCLPLLDGEWLCQPRLVPYALPSERACMIHEANMLRLQPVLPDGHRYRRAPGACSRTKPGWLEIPAEVPPWRFA